MTALLAACGVGYQRAGIEVLVDAGLNAASGECVGVLGPNGSGKTTLLRAVLGLLPLSRGGVRLSGCDPRRLSPAQKARLVGYLPQERRVAWNVAAWRVAALGAADVPPKRARAIADEALGRVGLSALAERGVLDMSGGERARVLMARLFATRAPLLVADEPAAGLDPDAQLLAMELLRRHAGEGGAAVVTLHDLSLAARYCDRVVVLGHGRVAAEGPPAEALSPEVLAQVFGLDGRLVATEAGPVVVARRLEPAA